MSDVMHYCVYPMQLPVCGAAMPFRAEAEWPEVTCEACISAGILGYIEVSENPDELSLILKLAQDRLAALSRTESNEGGGV